MKNINLYILEKFRISKDSTKEEKVTLTDIVPGVNFEKPTEEDCKKLEDALKEAKVLQSLPTGVKLDSRYHTYNYWFIGISQGGLALKANITFSKPYKKKETYNRAYIEFGDTDSFIAGNSGGVFYKYEVPNIWEKVIMPVANFFNAKLSKDGEFLLPGAKTHWNS